MNEVRCAPDGELWKSVTALIEENRRKGGFSFGSQPAAIIASEHHQALWQAVLAKCEELQHQPGVRPGMRGVGRLGHQAQSMSAIVKADRRDGTEYVYHVTAYLQAPTRPSASTSRLTAPGWTATTSSGPSRQPSGTTRSSSTTRTTASSRTRRRGTATSRGSAGRCTASASSLTAGSSRPGTSGTRASSRRRGGIGCLDDAEFLNDPRPQMWPVTGGTDERAESPLDRGRHGTASRPPPMRPAATTRRSCRSAQSGLRST